MADDPNKKRVDGWFVASQGYEYEYFKSMIKSEFPAKSEDVIAAAILACREGVPPAEGRAKLADCVRQRLRAL